MTDWEKITSNIDIWDLCNILGRDTSPIREGGQFDFNPCPICGGHGHFKVTADLKKYNCFGCTHTRGDIFNLYMELQGKTAAAAFLELKSLAGVSNSYDKNFYRKHEQAKKHKKLQEEKYRKLYDYFVRANVKLRDTRFLWEEIFPKRLGFYESIIDKWIYMDDKKPIEQKIAFLTKLKGELWTQPPEE